LEANPYPQRDYLQAARDAAAAIKPTPEEIAQQSGVQIARRLHERRVQAIAELKAGAPAVRPELGAKG
jgi:hypothetical protein